MISESSSSNDESCCEDNTTKIKGKRKLRNSKFYDRSKVLKTNLNQYVSLKPRSLQDSNYQIDHKKKKKANKCP